MKLKKMAMCMSILAISGIFLYGCTKNEQQVKIYDTTDLHSHFTKQLEEQISKIDRKNSLLLDAGDIVDGQTPYDEQWYDGKKSLGYISDSNAHVVEQVSGAKEGLPPVSKKMVEYKYDAATLGNHEFYLQPDELKNLIDGYNKAGVPILSANTFFNKEYIGSDRDQRVSPPYIIKKIHNKDKDIKIGIIGVTTNTINEEEAFKDGKEKFSDDVLLQNNPQYKGKYYMTDMVDESIKVAKELKKKENPDMIILIMHSGEKPRIPRHSGNRVQEMAKKVPYVDLIIAGHTHEFIDQHDYKGPDGKKVIVTQAGAHSKGIGEVTADFSLKDNKWKLDSLKAKNIKFKPDKNDTEDDGFDASTPEKLKEIGFGEVTPEEYRKMAKDNKNISLDFTVLSNKKIVFPQNPKVTLTHEYYSERENDYIYYFNTRDYDEVVKYKKLYE